MRASKHSRSMRRSRLPAGTFGDLGALASRVSYVGSAEHKTVTSFAGPPRPRSDATKCDPKLQDRDQITGWLRAAVMRGRLGGPIEGDFPRYVWDRVEGVPYEARLVNRTQGTYKGYSLTEDQWVLVSSPGSVAR